VTLPVALTVAMSGFELTQITESVRSWVLPSEKVPVADICWLSPALRLRLDGVIAIEVSTASVITMETGVDAPPRLTVKVADPAPTAVSLPFALTAATAELELEYVALVVTFCEVPSVKMAVTSSCCTPPAGRVTIAGVTCTLTTVAVVTVMAAVPLIDPACAVMVVAPTPTLVAKPEALMVATELLLDDQVTDVVRSSVDPSESVPIARYCCDVPSARVAVAGVTASETRVAGLTVSVAMPETPSYAAEIKVLPPVTLVANPVLEIVATEVTEDCHVTVLVRFCIEPSE
jgi:hypothetical protein